MRIKKGEGIKKTFTNIISERPLNIKFSIH